MTLPTRCARSDVTLARFSKRLIGITLWLGLAVAALPGHAIVMAAASCSPSWPNGISVPIKITDSLVLAIPLKYLRYEWINCRRSPAEIEKRRASLPLNAGAGFDFFLPDFSGYTMERFREPFGNDQVHVAYVVSARVVGFRPPDAAKLESDQFKNELRVLADTGKYRDMYGLRCYEGKILKNRMFCYSARSGEEHRGILLSVDVPPYAPGVNPLMRVNYFSKSYGQIAVSWWSDAKNLPHWCEIDSRLWQFMAAWNVAGLKKSAP